jgi:hypothetical protein
MTADSNAAQAQFEAEPDAVATDMALTTVPE